MKEQEEVSGGKSGAERRTLKAHEWPAADRLAWEAACKPSHRLTKGGSASHLAAVSQEDIARRYGLFLGFLRLNWSLKPDAGAAGHITRASLTGCANPVGRGIFICSLRRATEVERAARRPSQNIVSTLVAEERPLQLRLCYACAGLMNLEPKGVCKNWFRASLPALLASSQEAN